MDRQVLKTAGRLGAGLALLGAVAAAGSGFVYATARNSEQPQAAVAAQAEAESGVLIESVTPGGPAANAKVARGDILLQIDGRAVNTPAEVIQALKNRKPGEQVQLTVQHGDERRTLTATLGDRNGRAFLGVVPCGGPHLARFIAHAGEGAIIHQVAPDSPAGRAGLQVGDRITAVDGQKLDAEHTLSGLIGAHKPGDTVTLQVTRPGEQPRDVSVQLGEHPERSGAAYLGVQALDSPQIAFRDGEAGPIELPFLEGMPFGELGPGLQKGSLIRRVTEQSPAAQAGLERGDLITAIDGQPLDGPEALANAVGSRKPGDSIKLTVRRPNETETREVEVKLAESPDKPGAAYLGAEVAHFFHIERTVEGDPQGDQLIFRARSGSEGSSDPAEHQVLPAPAARVDFVPADPSL